MGNKPARQENTRDEILVKAMPPIDRVFARWLAHDVRRLHDFAPRKLRAIKPPEHYIEYMRLYGWLDLDMDDPDLAHLIK
ncbi:uncharacterized protein LOC122031865 [Zingiber officinale]|uniref:uncharacterized protein LOC122031865 n=1 Tax=Zingiber officinale TaxID=94328 RepID=UPI001C4C2C45|nr:uncharacterized protein LOC122031865 [Zingiber officinale]